MYVMLWLQNGGIRNKFRESETGSFGLITPYTGSLGLDKTEASEKPEKVIPASATGARAGAHFGQYGVARLS